MFFLHMSPLTIYVISTYRSPILDLYREWSLHVKYRNLLRLLAATAVALWSCSDSNSPTGPMASEEYDLIPVLMDFYDVPGVSIAIIRDFKIDRLLVYGVKDLSSKKPVATETLFQAGSISKPVAAVAALTLVQAGMLELDEDINNRLTTWKVPENGWTSQQKVTLRRLLSHRAGTTVHGFGGYDASDVLPSLVQVLQGEPPANTGAIIVDRTPGNAFRYSGGGYVIMQQALIDVTHRPFAQIALDAVLAPLAMTRSTYTQPLPQEFVPAASVGHDHDGNAVQGRFHSYPEMAAAGLWTTPRDLALFLIDIQLTGGGRRSSGILSTQMVQAMMRVDRTNPIPLGLVAVQPDGRTSYFGHDGSNWGFNASMLAHKSAGVGAVVMTNSQNGRDVIAQIMPLLGRVEGWPGY
jgi:CubicO group peptidase (beta-lactamase class C family)